LNSKYGLYQKHINTPYATGHIKFSIEEYAIGHIKLISIEVKFIERLKLTSKSIRNLHAIIHDTERKNKFNP